MSKKITVLAVALAALAAFALPTPAAASWKHHNTAIAADVQLKLLGQARFQGESGGLECQAEAPITLEAGTTTATVGSFFPAAETTSCKGLGGLAFCQYHEVVSTELPWAAHTRESPVRVEITQKAVHGNLTGGFCPIKQFTVTAGVLTATPNQANTLSSLQLSSQADVHLQANGGTVSTELTTISGTMTVQSPNANTYSI
ncbi:MAG TPA: hypothetical protein VFY48_09385 [Solirubrobacterales bacterium]|nr:hypothetical protein [Solirubrobacterales bacterium]